MITTWSYIVLKCTRGGSVFEIGSVQLLVVTVQAMLPVVSLPITAYPAARWLSVTRAGWRPTCRTQSARGTSSLARGPRKPITVAGKSVCVYVCVCMHFTCFCLKLIFSSVFRIGRPPKYRKNQQRDYQSEFSKALYIVLWWKDFTLQLQGCQPIKTVALSCLRSLLWISVKSFHVACMCESSLRLISIQRCNTVWQQHLSFEHLEFVCLEKDLFHSEIFVQVVINQQQLNPGMCLCLCLFSDMSSEGVYPSLFRSALSSQSDRTLSLCWEQHCKLLPGVQGIHASQVAAWSVDEVSKPYHLSTYLFTVFSFSGFSDFSVWFDCLKSDVFSQVFRFVQNLIGCEEQARLFKEEVRPSVCE